MRMRIMCLCCAVPNCTVWHGFTNRADPGWVRYGWRTFTVTPTVLKHADCAQYGSSTRVNAVYVTRIGTLFVQIEFQHSYPNLASFQALSYAEKGQVSTVYACVN